MANKREWLHQVDDQDLGIIHHALRIAVVTDSGAHVLAEAAWAEIVRRASTEHDIPTDFQP
jgi:hypothetical protein